MAEFQRVARQAAAPPPPVQRRATEAESPGEATHPLLTAQRQVGNQATASRMLALRGDAIARSPAVPVAAAAPAPLSPAATAALAEMTAGTLKLDDAAAWTALAGAGAALDAHERTLHGYFQAKVNAGEVGFETITANQRKVFKRIAEADRNVLRLKAIHASKLYQVVSRLHANPAVASRGSDVESRRMGRSPDQDFYTDALSGELANGDVMAEMLVEEVPRAASPGNAAVAAYVKRVLRETGSDGAAKSRIAAETLWMACGISNLFALAASRGKAADTKAGAKAWLKEVVLDAAPGQAFVTKAGGWDIHFNPVLKSLSTGGKDPKYSGGKTPMGSSATGATLQGVMAYANALESRIGIIQGTGHMYIVYRDMDDVWRTMDMYMSLADFPEGGEPTEAQTKFEKVVVD